MPCAAGQRCKLPSQTHKVKDDKSKHLADLTDMISRLSVGVQRGDALDDMCDALEGPKVDPGQPPSQDSLEAANTWFSLEDDADMVTTIQLDLQDELLSDRAGDDTDGDDSGNHSSDSGNDVEDRESEAVVKPPPYANVAEEFGKLEATARKSRLEDVSFHLEKARIAWTRARGSSKKSLNSKIFAVLF